MEDEGRPLTRRLSSQKSLTWSSANFSWTIFSTSGRGVVLEFLQVEAQDLICCSVSIKRDVRFINDLGFLVLEASDISEVFNNGADIFCNVFCLGGKIFREVLDA